MGIYAFFKISVTIISSPCYNAGVFYADIVILGVNIGIFN